MGVPGRLSVVGYDDIDLGRFVSPRLTTMAVDKVGMGRLAATLLLHRLQYGAGAATLTLIRPRLVERGSVRALEGASDAVSIATAAGGAPS